MCDRVVLVTGSAGSFGKKIVETFLSEGAIVHGCDKNIDQQKTFQTQLASSGNKFYPHSVDLSKIECLEDLVKEVILISGKIDVLVNCAGICTGTTIFDMTEKEWDQTYYVNVKAPFFLSQIVAKTMIESNEGKKHIINISSLVSFTGGILSSPAYSSSKSALTCTTKNFAKLLAPYGITVNEVAPGTAKTALSVGFIGENFDEFVEKIPLKRLCDPKDIANAVAFLASEGASYITGQIIHVNGGMLI